MDKSDRIRKMHELYGTKEGSCCRSCCNLHYSEKRTNERLCIAFSEEEKTSSYWQHNYTACGLYNRPFRLITPSLKPVIGKRPNNEISQYEQLSLFDMVQ